MAYTAMHLKQTTPSDETALSQPPENPASTGATTNQPKSTRLVSLDIARIISIAAVVSMHINEATLTGAARSLAVSFGSIGVPVFVMLTGYLMLHRDYAKAPSIKRFLAGNLLPLFVALEFWNIAWACVGWLTGSPIPLSQTLRVALFLGEIQGGFWFLPMIFGLYLGLPIMAWAISILRQPHMKTYAYILGIACLLFGLLIPTATELAAIQGIDTAVAPTLEFGLFGMTADLGGTCWPVYLFCGYLIRLHRPHGTVCALVSTLILVASLALLTCMREAAYAAEVYFTPANYANLLVAIAAISLICALHALEDKLESLPRILKSLLARMSAATFGVYMIHFTVLGQVLAKMPFPINEGCISYFKLGAIVLLFSYVISIALTFIPGVSRYIMLAKVRPHAR